MKYYIIIVCAIFFIGSAVALNAGENAPVQKTVEERLDALDKKIDKLLEIQQEQLNKILELEKKDKKQQPKVYNNISFSDFHRKSEERAAKIKNIINKNGKPDNNWTDEQVGDFLQEIYDITLDHVGMSSNDFGITVISQLGPQRVHVIIDIIKKNNSKSSNPFYFYQALKQMKVKENQQVRETVIKNLNDCPQLIEVVIENKWENYAKDEIINILKTSNKKYTQWLLIQALANLKDKQTYSLMKDTLVTSGNKVKIYDQIKDLPDIDLNKDVVSKAWNNADEFEHMHFAPKCDRRP